MKNKTNRLFLAFLPGLSACDKNEASLQEVQTRAPNTKIENFAHSRLQNNRGEYDSPKTGNTGQMPLANFRYQYDKDVYDAYK